MNEQDKGYTVEHLAGGETVMRPGKIYTPRQESRLTTFHHMLGRAMEAEASERNGAQVTFGKLNPQTGQVTESYMNLDGKFVYTWEHAAQNMYETEFAGNPKLEQAASNIRANLRAQYDGPPAMSADDLQRIWEIEDELHQLGTGGGGNQ